MEINYDKQVYDFLRNMPPGKSYELSSLCKKEPVSKFIESAKKNIRANWSEFGWKFSFNNEYTKLTRNESLIGQTFNEWIDK